MMELQGQDNEYVRVTSLWFVVFDTDRFHIQLDNLFNRNTMLGLYLKLSPITDS